MIADRARPYLVTAYDLLDHVARTRRLGRADLKTILFRRHRLRRGVRPRFTLRAGGSVLRGSGIFSKRHMPHGTPHLLLHLLRRVP